MEQTEEIKTVKIGDKVFDIESVTPMAIAILKDLKVIEDEISSINISLSITKLAKSKLLEELGKEFPKMKEV